MKIFKIYSLLLPVTLLFALAFWHTNLTGQTTMTFDTGPTHPGFTLTGWSGEGGILFPTNAGVGDIAQITKDDLTWDLVSFQTAPFGDGNGVWQATSDKGDTYTFSPNVGGAATHTLNWVGISRLKVSLVNIGSGGTNQSFDFDNVVYFENSSPVCNITLDGVSKLNATCCQNNGIIIVTPVTCVCVGDIEYSVNNGGSWQSSNFFGNLAPGSYTVKIRDAGNTGCETSYIANPVVVTAEMDNTLPIAVCQDVTLTLNTSGTAGITAAQVNDGSSDNCGIAGLSVSPNSFDCSDLGANTVTLAVTDQCNNTATCTANVTVALPTGIDNPCCPAPAYAITVSGSVLTITDNEGNGDILTVSQDGAGIKFETGVERSYRLNGGLSDCFPVTIPDLASFTSLVINAGGGADQVIVNGFTAAMPDMTVNGGAGNLVFTSSLTNNSGATRSLSLNSDGDIEMSQSASGGAAVNCTAMAVGNVTVSGTGWKTNGGFLSSSGVDFYFSGSQISTGGGDATFTHSGSVTIRGGGLATGGGDFFCNGSSVATRDAGVSTGGGHADIVATGNVVIADSGLNTCGNFSNGNITTQGVDLTMNGSSLNTCGGNVTLNHTGNVIAISNSGGGFFSSSGQSFTTINSGIQTGGGNLTLSHTGNVLIKDYGAKTNGGNFTSYGANLTVEDSGLSTLSLNGGPGGNVFIDHTGDVLLQAVKVETGGGEFIIENAANVTIKFAGVQTGGGYFSITASSINIQDNSVQTGGGHADLYAAGDISLSGGSFSTCGASANGSFAAHGVNLIMSPSPVTTCSGNVILNFSGDVAAIATTGGGSFTSNGNAFTTLNSGIRTSGGYVTLNHNGDVLIKDSGVVTGGGDYYSTGVDISIRDAGLNAKNTSGAGGGFITMNHSSGVVTIVAGGLGILNDAWVAISASSLLIYAPIDAGSGIVNFNTTNTRPFFVETDVTGSLLTIGLFNSLDIAINGATQHTDYQTLTVEGGVDITSANLVITGGHTPAIGQTFIIVENDGVDPIVGTFNGLGEGAVLPNFLGSNLDAVISYVGGDGNDVVLSIVPPCPDLSAPAPAAQVTNSACTSGCTVSGGSISAPATGCPDDATLQYSTDGGATWSTVVPAYNQTGPAQNILTRCLCDNDNSMSSPWGSVTTAPGACIIPATPVFDIAPGACPSTPGVIAATGCGPGTIVEYATDPAGPWSATAPAYTGPALTVYARCRDTATDCVGGNAVETVVDDIAPTALCQNATVYLDASGNASVTAAQVDNGSYDNCGIQGMSVSPNSFTCTDVGPNTVTLTVTDVNGLQSTCTAAVTVVDDIAPTALCQNATVYLDASGNASVTAAQVDNGSYDNCGIQGMSVSPNSFTCADVGPNTVTLTVTDVNGLQSTCTATVTVAPKATVSSISVSPNTRQYSDEVTFTATITGGASCSPQWQAAQSATFYVGTQEMGSAGFEIVGDDLVATLDEVCLLENVDGQMAPGAKSVTAVFSGIDNEHFSVSPPAPVSLQIAKEDATLAYNGQEYFSTPSLSNCTGTVTLSAYVGDSNDPDEGCRGDIRHARITFSNEGIPGATLGAANLPVGLINPGNIHEGIAVTNFTHTLSGSNCTGGGETFEVWIRADNYYTGAMDEDEVTLVTLALPGNDFVTGGGHLVLSNPAGSYAGTTGSKMNFGFNMKWNPSGNNLQGKINIIFRRLVNGEWRTYQIKSNKINSMSVNESDPNYRKAIISTKATLQDITNQNSPISLGGNLNLAMNAWEHKTVNNGSLDQISVSLSGNGSQGLLFASNWQGTGAAMQVINGGKIKVRNGGSQPLAGSPDSSQEAESEGHAAISDAETGHAGSSLRISSRPNPFSDQAEIIVETEETQRATLRVFDSTGRPVASLHDGMLDAGRHRFIFDAANLPGGFYFYTLNAGGKVKTGKMLLVVR